MTDTLFSIVKSWAARESRLNSTRQLLDWVRERNRATRVDIRKIDLRDDPLWFYDESEDAIHNRDHSFFSIRGLVRRGQGGTTWQQPIIMQEEIGYLGILCKEFDGVMHFLMQAKIEPGNINHVQLSPTIQATKSNFTCRHGGKQPPYLEYFLNAARHEVVVDQIQSEQSSRFWKKRNRNIVLRVDGETPLLPTHRWMTLGQVKALMREDNLVNMDTRTVLSCIPFCNMDCSGAQWEELGGLVAPGELFASLFRAPPADTFPRVFQALNDYKMFDPSSYELTGLSALDRWGMRDRELVCDAPWPFKVVFCDIAIEGREVRRWTQPLFEATGLATFGLLTTAEDGEQKFLARLCGEPGCFDRVELGPSVQAEAGMPWPGDRISELFRGMLGRREGVRFDTLLSEEGGRFYHEQNRNVILNVARETLGPLPPGCFLLSYRALNALAQFPNVLNIQLRNLLSVLEV